MAARGRGDIQETADGESQPSRPKRGLIIRRVGIPLDANALASIVGGNEFKDISDGAPCCNGCD